MKAVILAGGEGTRLRPLTCDLPKPLVPVCGKPVLFYILELLERGGCTEAAVAVRYKGARIAEALGDGVFGGLRTFVSYEDEPLGTAGCVKKAAADFDDDFMVISGDAVCDFDLAAIYEHHKRSGAAATIAARSVDDPREYGVILGENGVVTGFAEKPGFINCRSDLANTGIYVISPKVLGLVADGRSVDFAKDVFPEMLRRGMPLGYYEESGYWCDIGDIAAYKRCTVDMMNGRIKAVLPERDETAAAENPHIARSAFITKGAYVSPKALAAGNTAIGAGAYISDGAKLCGAIVMDGAFVGEGATLNDCIVCPNARIGAGAAVYENAVVGEGAVVGGNAVISGGVKIWTNKCISKGAEVTSDVKLGTYAAPELSEEGMTGATNTAVTPEFAFRAGSAAAKISESVIAVSCAEGNASRCLKNALLCGISSAGHTAFDCGEASLPMLAYSGKLLGADILIHVIAHARTDILIYSAGLLPLKRGRERILNGAVTRGEYMTAGWENFGEIRRFTEAGSLYEAYIGSMTGFTVPYEVRLVSRSPLIRTLCQPFAKAVSAGREKLTVTIPERGVSCEISCGDTHLDSVSVTLAACLAEAEHGSDIALPFSFPHTAEKCTEPYGKDVLRYFASSMDDCDENARRLASEQLFMRDGFALALKVLRYMHDRGMSPADIAEALPKVSAADRFIRVNCPPQRVLGRLNAVPEENEGAVLAANGERVYLRPDKQGRGIFMFAESFGTETAASLCDRTEKLIRNAEKQIGKRGSR